MAVVANRRSVMTLYSNPICPHSHRIRIVLAEKGINFELQDVTPSQLPDDLVHLNPYGSLPTLVDRDLVLYDSKVIMEYLDERFPHPPLMPIDPVSRAKSRLIQFRIDNDWFGLLPEVESSGEKKSSKAKKELKDSLLASQDLFAAKHFFLSDEFSLVDCSLAPLLWRLPSYSIDFPPSAKGIKGYAKRLFSRESFRQSMSEAEREMQIW